ncbi:type II toxin-antitoxin system VapC family toxin [Phyllobacterium leguminum]|uniref:PIN domain nuclease of toxin-antitoxin system n=1 Tax=Phyllobacterium leguminum TaxID=314237 RepID=A0A318T0T6_9HYPH|nr:type II toxin-antitoxin system VapC family toxin [Phyllobacterium leguminum]PYE87241.1 PIN domain nuclease of toxin-antitoxin system [Phyllobacterium leguminum]
MKHILLDTHTWAWAMSGDGRLSAKATDIIEGAENVYISPISLFEIGQKVRLGKWPEMKPLLDRLVGLIDEQGGRVAELSPAIALTAATLDWAHRDPFDRILGATALDKKLVLVSADAIFDELSNEPGWSGRVW